jgi:predicted RNase H-like HicB family nuclease
VREFRFWVIVEPDLEDGGFVATTPVLAGVAGQGETRETAVRDLEDALDFTLQSMEAEGEPLPEADQFARPAVEGEEALVVELKVAV